MEGGYRGMGGGSVIGGIVEVDTEGWVRGWV